MQAACEWHREDRDQICRPSFCKAGSNPIAGVKREKNLYDCRSYAVSGLILEEKSRLKNFAGAKETGIIAINFRERRTFI